MEKGGGTLNGGYMLGNIVSPPGIPAVTLLASCAVHPAGIPGGLFMALVVYIGNRICYDPGYAGTTGCVTATFIVYGYTQMGFLATDFIAGMVFAILTIQGSPTPTRAGSSQPSGGGGRHDGPCGGRIYRGL